MTTDSPPEVSRRPAAGWHCNHLYYRFDRARLHGLSDGVIREGRRRFAAILDPDGNDAPARLQVSITSGQKADFGLLLMDGDPLVLDSVHQRLMAGDLGRAIEPVWSFVSMTEVSEYLPTLDQYGRQLADEGLPPDGPEHQEKLSTYERRLQIMTGQRLQPDLPAWPATCFYPMNRHRRPEANWFELDFNERSRMMRQHGASGMQYAGRVTQLVTAAIGLDDWEWGVTLWARNPEFLKDIVYQMRFDEASARYAEFGPFYTGYLASADEVIDHCHVG